MQRRETTALFVSNIVLTTRLKKLIEENKELRKTIASLEASSADPVAVELPRDERGGGGQEAAQAQDQGRGRPQLHLPHPQLRQGLRVR